LSWISKGIPHHYLQFGQDDFIFFAKAVVHSPIWRRIKLRTSHFPISNFSRIASKGIITQIQDHSGKKSLSQHTSPNFWGSSCNRYPVDWRLPARIPMKGNVINKFPFTNGIECFGLALTPEARTVLIAWSGDDAIGSSSMLMKLCQGYFGHLGEDSNDLSFGSLKLPNFPIPSKNLNRFSSPLGSESYSQSSEGGILDLMAMPA